MNQPISPLHSKRPILVVDDEPQMLLSLKDLLRRDFVVYTAASGKEGLDLLQQNEIHVVMSDQRMPEMTGVEFLTRAKWEHPEAVRLIFTGYADLRALIDAINEGNVYRYVTKPWDPEELVAALQAAGEAYDAILDRRNLLGELREYEQRCVRFDAALRSGQYGALTPDGAAEAEALAEVGRALRGRLDRALAAERRAPPS